MLLPAPHGGCVLSLPSPDGWGPSAFNALTSLVLSVWQCVWRVHALQQQFPSTVAVMQVAFGLLIPLVLYVIYYRIWVLKELSLLKQVK